MEVSVRLDALCSKKAPDRDGPSEMMLKTFRRLRLHEVLREQALLRSIVIDGEGFSYDTTGWKEYWGDIPAGFQCLVDNLEKSWRAYLASGLIASLGKSFSDSYLQLIRKAATVEDKHHPSNNRFAARILGLENFIFKFRSASNGFAAATASFRSPLFLSFGEIRKNSRNDPSLLPLILALDNNIPDLYYHYRKHRLLKNTDESMLLFPAIDPKKRHSSFQGLQFLAGKIFTEWDSRIEQRSHLLANKVFVPWLKGIVQERRALRILDIGSGVGLFTSKVISKIINSGVLAGRKMELSLLDILKVDPKKHFQTSSILPAISKSEYISSDFTEWLDRTRGRRKFDLVFLFRILHNFSDFCIDSFAADQWSYVPGKSRYRFFPHLSDYYSLLSRFLPAGANQRQNNSAATTQFGPRRFFNQSSLVTDCGESIIRRLGTIADNLVIEDGDLSPEALVQHLSKYRCEALRVYDLSQHLRLSINHVYWISRSEDDILMKGKLIWPR